MSSSKSLSSWRWSSVLAAASLVSAVAASPAFAQEPAAPAVEGAQEGDPLAQFKWQLEGIGKLGSQAEISIPEGFRFLTGSEASKLIEAMGNLSSKEEVGLIGTGDLSWFVVFFFDDVGFVKDDEKDELDADKMAESMREGLTQSNEVRKERGMTELHFDGWAIPPRYNAQSKQLEWAQRLRSIEGVSVNYNTRVLGRRGVMRVILVCDPELLDATLPGYGALMGGFKFQQGEDYASYRDGDKIAEFGLAALVVGGAGAVAAKTGLLGAVMLFFKKGAKFVILAIAGLFVGIKKLLGKRDGNAPA